MSDNDLPCVRCEAEADMLDLLTFDRRDVCRRCRRELEELESFE